MNIALLGYGKMGHEIEKIALKRGHNVVLKIDVDKSKKISSNELKQADVVIEFSTPDSAVDNYLKCFEAQLPVVSGTTGWLEHRNMIENKCIESNSAFFYASNFSLGVNVFFELNKRLASLMKQFSNYDVDLEETHHIHKLDAPSGTAISLAEGIIENTDSKQEWTLESSFEKFVEKKYDDSKLAVRSFRKGEVPGTHSIRYFSEVDEIKITHEAYGRQGFALGAVIAAEFLRDKKGVFSMNDLLKF